MTYVHVQLPVSSYLPEIEPYLECSGWGLLRCHDRCTCTASGQLDPAFPPSPRIHQTLNLMLKNYDRPIFKKKLVESEFSAWLLTVDRIRIRLFFSQKPDPDYNNV